MNKLTILVALVACVAYAEAGRVRFLARQQQPVAANPTGYPPSGVTPETPFELPSERTTTTAKPDSSYLPPDNTYGPPEAQPDAVYGPPADNAPEPQPDAVYGPPTTKVDEDDEELNTEQPSVEEQIDEERIEKEAVAEEEQEEEEEEVVVAVAEDGSVIAVSTAYDEDQPADEVEVTEKSSGIPARLFYQRFPQGRRQRPAPSPVPERLTNGQRLRRLKYRN